MDKQTKLLVKARLKLRELLDEIDDALYAIGVEENASDEDDETLTLSCDGSILKNPGGRCAVGAVIQVPGNDPVDIAQFTPSKTNNEAEFDAIYVGLSNVFSLYQIGCEEIVVESDSKLVVDSLNGKCTLKTANLVKKRDLILEKVTQEQLVPVSFVWKKRNSTPGLLRANNLAQSLNGVKNH